MSTPQDHLEIPEPEKFFQRLPQHMKQYLVDQGIQPCNMHNGLTPEPARIMAFDDPTGGKCLLPDPRYLDRWSQSWRLFNPWPHETPVHAWRTQQVLKNLSSLNWDLERDQWSGEPMHILCSGPSLIKWDGSAPGRSLAINRAIEHENKPDLWFVCDALMPDNPWTVEKWLTRWAGVAKNVHGVFHLHARHEIAMAAASARFYLPCSPEHREFIIEDKQAELPQFSEGIQALLGAMHLADYLGCSPIILWGADQARPVGGPYYAKQTGAPTCDWREVDGILGKVETTGAHLWAWRQAQVQIAWLIEAGRKVWNCSEGLDYVLAPYFQADHAADACAGMMAATG